MSATLIDRFGSASLLDDFVPLGERRTAGGSLLSLATAEVGGRRILLAHTAAPDAAVVVQAAALAESLGMLSLTVVDAELTGAVLSPALTAIHALVAPAVAPAVAGELEAAGFMHVTVGDHAGAVPILTAADAVAGIDLAALLLSYLRGADGRPAEYAYADRPDVDRLEPAAERNAVAALFAVADDALLLLPHHVDEVVLAVARVHGRSVAVLAPQPLAATTVGAATLARVETLLRFAARAGLPVVVLGGLQEPDGDADLVFLALQRIAARASSMSSPVLTILDDTDLSSLDAVVRSTPGSITLDPTGALRAALASALPSTRT